MTNTLMIEILDQVQDDDRIALPSCRTHFSTYSIPNPPPLKKNNAPAAVNGRRGISRLHFSA